METYQLNEPSEEQRGAIDAFNESNIIVDSVAGSGKTTLALHIALAYCDLKILLLTYNAKLKIETRQKVDALQIQNMEVHSYHSFCVKYYHHECFTDSKIIKLIKDDVWCKPKKKFEYDLVILDEAQDMSPLYFELFCHIIQDNSKDIRICVMGDQNQSIFQFNQADERFIKFANFIFNTKNNRYPWSFHKLSKSFRITNQMAQMVNNVFLNEQRIFSDKEGTKPKYIICDSFGNIEENKVYEEVLKIINEGYEFSDIFVLAPSVKSEKSPVRKLANLMSENNIPIFVPVTDESKLDEELLIGKIVFSTYHQVKGLERKVVIIMGLDNSYFEFYKKDNNPMICPNEIYVACTRAKERLIMIHHYQNDYLPFLIRDNLNNYCEVEKTRLRLYKKNRKDNFDTGVTDFIKHLPVEVVHNAMSYIDQIVINEPTSKISIPMKTKQNNLYEGVSEITSIAIPSYFEYLRTGKMSIFEFLKKTDKDTDDNEDLIQVSMNNFMFDDSTTTNSKVVEKKRENNELDINRIDLNELTTEELLWLSNKWNTYKTGYIFKVKQIDNYDWLSHDNLRLCMERLKNLVSKKMVVEVRFEIENRPELKNRKIIGYIDCIDKNNIWEFKCVHSLDNEHKLQLAVYMYLYFEYKKKIVLSFNLNEDSDIEEEEEEDDTDEIKSDIEERLVFLETMKVSLEECTVEEGHDIDFVIDGTLYEDWIIKKVRKNGSLSVLNNKTNEKMLIEVTNIFRNLTLESLRERIHNDIKDLKHQLDLIQHNVKIKSTKESQELEDHFYLYNILDGHQIEIKSDLNRLKKMMDYLIDCKYFRKNFISDDEFIDKCTNVVLKVCV